MDPARHRKITKPGGTERDRVDWLWELTAIDATPDQHERQLLYKLADNPLMNEPLAVLRATIEWQSRREFPVRGGDGFASVEGRALHAVYEYENPYEALRAEDASFADPDSAVSMPVATARDRAGARVSAASPLTSDETAFLSDIEDVEWEDTDPYPTITVRGVGGLTVRLTDFSPHAGELFYDALASELEDHWATGTEAEDALADMLAVVEETTEQRGEPPQALIRSAAEAEEAAAAWMRWLGIADAAATPLGPDEGVDVVSDAVVAQVKAQMVAIGRPDVQRLLGAAARADKRALFFSLGGYTQAAIEFADATEIALYTFDLQGQPEPTNVVALDLMRGYLD